MGLTVGGRLDVTRLTRMDAHLVANRDNRKCVRVDAAKHTRTPYMVVSEQMTIG